MSTLTLQHIPPAARRAVRRAALRYVTESGRGITRQRRGRAFAYFDTRGRVLHDPSTLQRIRALAIPPAWRDVWICPSPRGHLQAVGYDARGRKQYRYHPRWREVRDQAKFDRLEQFSKCLPGIRRQIAQDLQRPGLPKEKVLALLVRLLERTLIRVGNKEYARKNHSFGLTTLKSRHASIQGEQIQFQFRGKSGVRHFIHFRDSQLARLVKRIQDLPGQELFQYLDESGKPRGVNSADLNRYLKQISGENFTAKDFRTWAGTLLALRCLTQPGECELIAARKQHVVDAVRHVAKQLHNTVAVCRKCYIHPAVLETYLASGFREIFPSRRANHRGPFPTRMLHRLLRHWSRKNRRGTAQRTPAS